MKNDWRDVSRETSSENSVCFFKFSGWESGSNNFGCTSVVGKMSPKLHLMELFVAST